MFKKLAYFTDIHWGRKSNNLIQLGDNLDFMKWFIDEAKTRGCDTFIFGGDFFDNRHQLSINTMNMGLDSMQDINDTFDQSYFILGNHDLFFKNSRDVTSVELARNMPNIQIIRNPLTIGDVTFLPWLVDDEHKSLKNIKSRYVFAHLEVPGFLMNAKVEMPDSAHATKSDNFVNQEFVFTGHFHMRQVKNNIVYTGNVMPFDFADNWDSDRGAMFMEWGGQPEFVSWPDQPLFRTMKLSEMLTSPEQFLCPKLTARVSIDVDITYEDAQLIKESFAEDHGLRKVELIHQQSREGDQEFNDEVIFQSIDQIVIDGLTSVQSLDLKPDTLIEIYRNLAQ